MASDEQLCVKASTCPSGKHSLETTFHDRCLSTAGVDVAPLHDGRLVAKANMRLCVRNEEKFTLWPMEYLFLRGTDWNDAVADFAQRNYANQDELEHCIDVPKYAYKNVELWHMHQTAGPVYGTKVDFEQAGAATPRDGYVFKLTSCNLGPDPNCGGKTEAQ